MAEIGDSFRVQIADGFCYYEVTAKADIAGMVGTEGKVQMEPPEHLVQVEAVADPQYGEIDYIGHFGALAWVDERIVDVKIAGEERLKKIFGDK